MKQSTRGRPPKPPGEKSVRAPLSVPPDVWEAFKQVVPEGERSEVVTDAMRREIRRRRRASNGETVGPDRGAGAVAAPEDLTPAGPSILEQIGARAEAASEEEMVRWPHRPDGSEQHDHYIYGTRKRPR
jgi:hypothetical protein